MLLIRKIFFIVILSVFIFSFSLLAWNISMKKESVVKIVKEDIYKQPTYIPVKYKRQKTFSAPEEKISKWIYFRDKKNRLKIYGSLLVKAKGEEGVAFYLVRVWDGEKYHFRRFYREKLEVGKEFFKFKDKNGLTYKVKISPHSYNKKTLIATIEGKVLSPDFIY